MVNFCSEEATLKQFLCLPNQKPQLDLDLFASGSFAKFDWQGVVVRDNVFHLVGPEM